MTFSTNGDFLAVHVDGLAAAAAHGRERPVRHGFGFLIKSFDIYLDLEKLVEDLRT